MTEINLRSALFGEARPQGLLSVGGDVGDPLSQLPASALPAELHRAVLGLLITEARVDPAEPSTSRDFKFPHPHPAVGASSPSGPGGATEIPPPSSAPSTAT